MVARLFDRLSFRQARNTVLVALFLGLLFTFLEVAFAIERERDAIDETMQQVVRIVQEAAAKASYEMSPEFARGVLKGLFSFRPVYRASVYHEFGLLAEDERPPNPDPWYSPLTKLLFGEDKEVRIPLAHPVAQRPPLPVGELRATADIDLLATKFLNNLGTTVLVGLVRNLLLGLVLTAMFHLMVTKPILAVSREMQTISPAEPSSTRVACPSGHNDDEIGLLVRRINEVLAAFDAALVERDHYAAALDAARQRAEEASHAKSQFLATVSHELRTPLNHVIGFSELIKSGVFAPEAQADYANEILVSGNQLLALINDILEMAEIDTGRHRIVAESVEVRQLFDTCGRVVEGLARDRGVGFHARVAPSCPPLMADARAIRQVLNNVLVNAVKFTPQGGRVELSAVSGSKGVVITVADTGVGIPPDHLARVFEPFWQPEPFLSRRHEGVGLGLPLAKALTELQGGTLGIDSAPGRGTTVTVVMPAAEVPAAAVSA